MLLFFCHHTHTGWTLHVIDSLCACKSSSLSLLDYVVCFTTMLNDGYCKYGVPLTMK